MMKLEPLVWRKLASLAGDARENARIFGKTRVGAAVMSENGQMFSGCNIEHKFHSHDMHAEAVAIGAMVAQGGQDKLRAVVVVAERDMLMPCGSCCDWIQMFATPDCEVTFQSVWGSGVRCVRAAELMPYYPR